MRLRKMAGILVTGVLLLAAPTAAQERNTESYNREVGAAYVFLTEEGGYKANGFLVDGGFRFCTLGSWRCQAIAELMVASFGGNYDVTYKQFAGGVRFGQLTSPKLRVFAQFQVGAQNDGFTNSNTGVVFLPGVGVNYALTELLDLKVTVDVPFARYNGETFNQFRLAAGLSVPFGR